MLKEIYFSVLRQSRSLALSPLFLPSNSQSLSSVEEKCKYILNVAMLKCRMCLLKITRNDWKTCSYEIGMELKSRDILFTARVL